MKHRWQLVLLLSLPLLATAQTVSLTSRITGLAPVPTDQAATLAVSRAKTALGLGVISEFNCDTKPADAQIFVYRHAVTVSVRSVTTSDAPPIGALCSAELRFVLSGISKGPEVIYYVQDGHVMGHASVP